MSIKPTRVVAVTLAMACLALAVVSSTALFAQPNPGGPSFAVPGNELHFVLRPGLVGERIIRVGGDKERHSSRQNSGQKRCEQAEHYLRHYTPPGVTMA